MKRTLIFVLAALAVMAVASTALAEEVPELRGTWQGTSYIHSIDGLVTQEAAMVINVQEGRQFRGYKMWFNDKKILQREVVAGIFDKDGRIYFGEGDRGYAFGYLTGKEKMTINYLESGATAKTIILELERVHFSAGFVEIDKDGDKTIIQSEITTYYPLNAERIIKEADRDNDGKLTMSEWEKWKKGH
ncbi:calcium-binding protein [Pseudodesulfovibrio sp. zrk46]|uniref:calcium-binding protein n=1 Tax=Pseudodesulfovibrio sp. zrk46 TaxID=2725288 RepID=UPI001449422A|nr:calcium-binding protein [Pseudodesulfovibrio sp. zrk46]QJB56340.1 calcium-binding protein [Pseudodesulfovibrio sp. zrk46]